jgi:hypothetical protein
MIANVRWGTLLLVLGCACSQEPGAGDQLGKIEQVLKNAKTLRIKSDVEGTLKPDGGAEQNVHRTVTLLYKEGNKLVARVREVIKDKDKTLADVEHVLVSDGAKSVSFLVSRGQQAQFKEGGAPTRVKEELAVLVARVGGTVHLTQMLRPGNAAGDTKETLESMFVVSNAKQGSPDQGAAVLNYTVGEGAAGWACELKYDPKTFLIQKRRATRGGQVFAEKFTEYSVDVDVPDDTFTLPKQDR